MKSFLLCLPSAYEFSRIGLTPHKHISIISRTKTCVNKNMQAELWNNGFLFEY